MDFYNYINYNIKGNARYDHVIYRRTGDNMNLFDGTINTLTQSLDYAATKNRTIANNVANVDTPAYKSKDVAFKNVLNDQMSTSFETKRTHSKHITFNSNEAKAFHVFSKNNTQYNHNGNNVDIDKEMSELAENQIYYQAVVDRLNGKFSNIQTVLRGGS